ncbi:MAG: TrkH family potassium uptake protein [Nitratireductor sp.]|nr:TrkH family potassium uptake protein [Nitratireductor sp.]
MLVNGLLLATLGVSMLLPAVVDLVADNDDWQVFATASMVTILVGAGMYGGARGTVTDMSTRQAFALVTCAWILLPLFGALPYMWSGMVPSFTDAAFESMSGITTTGSTVMTGLDFAPPGILLWRGIQQWLGGLGIIVMAVAVLPMLQVGGMQLFKIEAFDTAEKIMPRATQISGSLTAMFAFITLLCALAYLATGMAVDDAVIHAMTTVATGGFSTKDASLAHFDSFAIDGVATLFMIAGSIPFIFYVQAMRGQPQGLFRNSQIRVFLVTLAVLTLFGWWLHPEPDNPLRGFFHSLLNVTSLVTGTGYTTTDYSSWSSASQVFFFLIMFIGGCAGSTSCGIKIFRFQIAFETIRQHLWRTVRPNGIVVMRYNGLPLKDEVSAAVMNFFFLFALVYAVVTLALNLAGLDFMMASSAAATALANVGPGMGDVIGPVGNFQSLNDTSKWILTLAMMIGRLELLTVLVLFIPAFWRA